MYCTTFPCSPRYTLSLQEQVRWHHSNPCTVLSPKKTVLRVAKKNLLGPLVLVYLPQGCENEKILVLFSQQLGSAVTILEVPQDAKLRSDLGA